MPSWDKLRFYGASDHAVSVAQKADKSCLMIVAVDDDDHIWIMPDTLWARLDSAQAIEAMVTLMKKYRPQFWWGETGAIQKSIGPFLRKRMHETQAYCALDPIAPASDKQQRAQAIQARSTMKMVHFPTFARWWPQAQDQILKFPHAANDDFVDALALVGLGLTKMRGRNRPVERAEVVEGTFREMFANTRRTERRERNKYRGVIGWR
jgi:predicted phage terminase large subunit-like protein